MSPPTGVLVIDADSAVCHVDSAAADVLESDRSSLLDGTAKVLQERVVTSEGVSYPGLQAFVDEFLDGEMSIQTVWLSNTYPADVRRSHSSDGRNGAIVTVGHKDARPRRSGSVDSASSKGTDAMHALDARVLTDAIDDVDVALVIADASPTTGEPPTIGYANAAFSRMTGYASDESLGKSLFFHQGAETDPNALRRIQSTLKDGCTARETIACYKKNGQLYWNDVAVVPLSNVTEGTTRFVSVQQDVSDRHEATLLLDGYNDILKEIAAGTPLSGILSRLVGLVEQVEPDLTGSIMRVNQSTGSLEYTAGPSLPEEVIDTVNDINVAPDATPPGAAAHRAEVRITEDIEQDDRWNGHRDSVLEHDLRACWSIPITGKDGDVLGTVTFYRSQPGAPGESERSLMEMTAQVSAVAIEYDRQMRAHHLQEEQFQRLVENAQPIVFLLDEKGTVLISEGEDLNSLGLEPGELVGESIYEIYEDEPTLIEYIDRALAGENVDSILRLGDLVFDIWYSPYYNTNGDIAGCIGMAVNITDRQEAEEALRFNRELLRRTQELAGVGGWEYDPQSDSMVGTEETYRIYEIPVDTDFTLEESLGFYPPELKTSLREAAAQCLHEGEPFDLEGPMRADRGTERWVRIRGEARRNDDGAIVKMVGTVQDLTERHKMEAELRERKRWLQSINENVAGGIYRSTSDRLVYANQAFLELFGYESLEEMTAQDPRAFYENPEVRSDLIRRGNKQGGIDGMEVEYRRKDGSKFTGLLRSRRVDPEGDDLTYYDGVVTDITEQKAREQKYRRQREKIKAVYESSGRLLEANTHEEVASIVTSVLIDTFGYPEVSVRCRKESRLVPVAFQPPSLSVSSLAVSGESIVAETYRSGETGVFDGTSPEGFDSKTSDNHVWAGIPLGDYGILSLTSVDGNGITRFDLRLIDILAQKATAVLGRIEHEKQLRDSEERFRGLFEEAAVGIALIDPEGIILEANSALTAMFKATRHELQGRRFTDLSHPRQRDSLATGIQEIIEDNRPRYEIEHRYVREDDSVFWGRLTVSRHKGPGAAEAICMIEDVSSRKQYERELKEAKEEAEEASRLKSALLANMSHEIRTPLTSIIGFAGILKDSLSGSNAEYARLAHEGGERLMDTLDSVLQLSKLEAGVIQPSTQQMDLVQLARRTVELSRPEAEAADLSLTFEAPEDTLRGRWAPTAVQRVLSNLIRNAVKFTPEGGTITIRVESSGSTAVLQVEDTGVGISDEFRPRLFDAFTQESEGLKRDYEGSGLGLAIVNRLVDLLEGKIEVESTKGQGSRFTVVLPLNE